MKKKILIPVAIVLVAACAQPFLKDEGNGRVSIPSANYSPALQVKDSIQPTASSVSYSPPNQPQENTHHFIPEFSALNIPDEMRQNFRINANASQVIVGASGTMILVPDNAFADANGNAVQGKVKMEIVEGIKNADILKMNLGTMSDQGPLETAGMVYINAFSENGDTLQLASGKQLEIEMPTDNKKSGMQLWEGITHKDGSVSWTDPQPLKEELRQIPVSALEEKGQDPKDAYKIATIKMPVIVGNPAEEKTKSLVFRQNESIDYGWRIQGDSGSVLTTSSNGIAAENLADAKFENTNIATVEFRSRLPFIRQACDSRVMLCYTDYPTRALWKSDQAAADILEKSGCALADVFRSLADLKQDKVNPADPNTVAALNAAREKAVKNYSDNVREMQRYNSYSFGMKKLGWANVDCLAYGGKLMFLNAHVKGADSNTQVRLIVPGRNIFIPGYKRPNGDYSFTHGEQE
ncbi:MAG: hypothetical protein M3R17_12840, partial [Bacteroidota bacterium]|nr:hypothetical protein [Bacteroidota bacterium]